MEKIAPSEKTAWVWLGLFAVLLAFLGGSSRPDAIQIVPLRSLAALFLIPAFYYLTRHSIQKAKPLVVLMALFSLLMAVQLVPLPPGLWQGLPHRDVVAQIDQISDLGDVWRPLSSVPSRGWNALASLVVPIAALLLALSLRTSSRMLLMLIAGLGLFDALLGLLQVVSGGNSAFYVYAVTNEGFPVGIFANENHSAVFSALTLIILTRLGVTAKMAKERGWIRASYPVAFVMVLLSVLSSGSRAGLAMTLLALVVSAALVGLSGFSKRKRKVRGGSIGKLAAHPKAVVWLCVAITGGLIGLFFGLGQAPAFDDFFTQSAMEDLRWSLWPVLERMIGIYWMLGSGFGSFEEVYHIYEPTELLFPRYINQAHNDWAQFVIEGGLPALAIMAALIGWVVRRFQSLVKRGQTGIGELIAWLGIIGILCAASLVDYPLRTPTFQLVGVWLLVTLAFETTDLSTDRTQ